MTTKSEQSVEPARWYIVHTYSGQEERVKRNLDLRIQSLDMQDRILRVIVPTENEIVIKDGKRHEEKAKVFPGYILVEMRLDDESWYVVRNTPGVTGFVSMEDEREGRSRPVPLEEREVQTILDRMESGPPAVKVSFERGSQVRISEGPFADFIGTVDEVDIGKGKLMVLVSFFGRETPVELDFLQVEKV